MQQVARYIPQGARKVASRKCSAVCYVYEKRAFSANPFVVIAYAFKRGKPEFHFSYPSEEARAKKIGLFFKGVECAEVYKQEQKVAAKTRNAPGAVKVGQVFVSSWGYDQTNVDFYEVVGLKGNASALVVKIAGETLEGSEGSLCGQCIPSTEPDRAAGKEPFVARIKGDRIVSSKIYGRGGASAWEGQPKYWSAYA